MGELPRPAHEITAHLNVVLGGVQRSIEVSLADDLARTVDEWCVSVQLTDENKRRKLEGSLRGRLDTALAQAWAERERSEQEGAATGVA